MKFLVALLVTTLCSAVRGSPQLAKPIIVKAPAVPLHASYHVDGSLHFGYPDLTSNIFDRHDFFIQYLRHKRATGFSYATPDSRRSEQFTTYTDPRTRDNHPLNRYQGHVSWTSPEGIPFSMDYVADGAGYHPTGQHLPGSPHHTSFFIIGPGAV